MGRKVVKAAADKSIKHAVLWIRVSSREQKEGYSLDAQEDRLKNYCTQRGLAIVKQFTVVESSTRGEREEFYNMIAFIKKYKSPVALVCDKVDRLQRSFKEYNVLNELIEKEKIAIHFNTEQSVIAKNAKAHDKLMWNFRITVAQSQTDTMSDNVCRSLEKMRKEGKWAHHAPVGYKNVRQANGHSDIVLDEDNHFIITQLFKEFSTGIYNLEQIVRKATNLGLKMKSSNKLHKQTIRNILAGFADKESRLVDLFTEGSITQDLYTKKLTEYRQDKKKLEERLGDYNHLTKQGLITLKYLAGLLLMSDQIWDFLNNDKKQRILKLLCSEILLDGKNVVISIRKPILALAKIGSCPVWLGWLDSNQRMTIPKTVALPLGDTPIKQYWYTYDTFFVLARVFLCL